MKTPFKQIAFLFYFFTLINLGGLSAQPFVPEATNRVKLNFNTNWLYKMGDVTGSQATNFNDNGWDPISLPHTMREEPLLVMVCANYQGIAWYRRHFEKAHNLLLGI